MSSVFTELMRSHPAVERDQWARWVLGSHSDQFIPEMTEAVAQLDKQHPVSWGRPVINPGAHAGDVVVLACERGKHCLVLDQSLDCELVLFDWTGEGVDPQRNPHQFQVLSIATECKGHLMEESWKRLPTLKRGNYMAFIDDDVLLRASDINTLLAMARIHDLSAAQPAVTFNSSLCQEYGWLRQRACSSLHRVPIVEIMAPFIRSDLLELVMPFLSGVRSGYGFDRFALPLCAAHLGVWRFAAIDSTPLSHVRQFGSLDKQFSNGLLSKEEELLIRQRLMQAMGFLVDQASYKQLEKAVAV